MSRLLNISYGLLIVVACLVSSCSSNRESIVGVEILEKLDESYEVDRQFSAEQLGRGNLIAFESRAKEKLKDFFNYLTIISDPEYDTAFRNHSVNLALALFMDDEVGIPISVGKLITVRELLTEHLNNELNQREYEVLSVEVSRELQQLETQGYSGRLTFTVSITDKDQNSEVNTGELSMNAVKIEKYFGEDKRSVWEVFLGK